jgi:hypothetical protein
MKVLRWNENPSRESDRPWSEPPWELRERSMLRVDAVASFVAAVVCSVVLFWVLMAAPAWQDLATGVSAWYTDNVTAYEVDQTASAGRFP